jgi:AsmA protein
MKSGKIIGFIVAGVVLLILIALLAVTLLVDPNQFKSKIAAEVKESTGRELKLEGDIKLSVFPWVALKLGPASLGSPPEFKDTPFLSFNRAEVRVRLLPLLSKRLEVARIELDGLNLNLVKHPDGKANWQMDEDNGTPEAQPKPAKSSGGTLDSIAGIAVTHGRVSYNQYIIENLDFETGSISAKRDVPVALKLDANRGVAGEQLLLTAKLTLQDNPDNGVLQIAALNVDGTITKPGDSRPMHYELTAPMLETNLDKQTLSLPEFSMSLGAAHVTGRLSGTKIIDDVNLTGSITLTPLVLSEFAPRFGITLPKTQDPKALTSLSFGTSFTYDASGATLDNMQIKLDDTTLKGNIKLAMGKTQGLKFALAADKIDLDRYRPPVGSMPDPKSAAANQPKPKASTDKSEPMMAEGTFTLAAAHAAGLDFTNLSVTVDMKDNITHLQPLEAQLYGGRYSGDLTYDTRTATPALSMDEHLTSVDVARLTANTKAKGRVSGKATVNIKGTARGAGADDIMKTLNGHFDANLANGAIEGMDVGYELAMATALLNKQAGTSVQNTRKTAFDAFKTSAVITNGVAETHDLTISSTVIKVGGQGTINLPTSGIDMTLLASVMKSATTTAVDIPLKVTGTYTDPNVKPDLSAAAKDALKQKAQDILKKNGLDLDSLFKKK